MSVSQELVGERTDTALRLDGLHNDRGGLGNSGVVVVDHGLHIFDHIQTLEHIGGRNVGDVVEGRARAVSRVHLGGEGQRAEGHAVEAAHEGEDIASARVLSRELDGSLDGVGAGGAAELDLIAQTAGLDDFFLKRLDELALGHGVHIERVDNAVGCEIVDHLLLDVRIVVAVVDGAGAAEEIDILGAVLVGEHRALRVGEYLGEVAAIRAHRGFVLFKSLCVHGNIPSICYCIEFLIKSLSFPRSISSS